MLTKKTKWLQEEQYGDQKKTMLTKENKMVTRKTWWQEQYGEDKKNNFVTRRTW